MLDAMDQRLRQREYLMQISRALTAQLDTSNVLHLVIDVAVDLLAGTSGLIALQDDTGAPRVQAASHLPPEAWPLFEPLLHTPLHDEAAVRQRLRQIAADTNLPLRQVIALPLVFRRTQFGVIYVFRAALNVGFTHEEEELLTAFADQAAIAVSNARLYQTALREKQQSDAVIEQSADGVLILDARWRITTFNRAMEQLTGWPRAEAFGRPCAEVLPLTNNQGIAIDLIEFPPLPSAGPDDAPLVEGWTEGRDGRRRFVQSSYAVLRGPGGEFNGAIINVRDVTEQRVEEEMQSTFFSVISHELKTPVSIIKGYAETLARPDAKWDEATLRDGLQVIIEETDRLTDQIQDLLDASRIQAGGLRLELSDFALPPLAKQIAERFAVQAGDRFTFELRFPDSFPMVHADPERVQAVLENLVSNAVKYSPDGGAIRITGRVDGRVVLVAVADHGIGIASEEQKKLFRRFYRVDNRLRRETQGAGLGLFLSRSIVEAHGGQLWVESTPGRGSRFSFTLPLATPQLVDAAPDAKAAPAPNTQHPRLVDTENE